MVFFSYIQPADIRSFIYEDHKFEITINGVAMPPRFAAPQAERDVRWIVTEITLQPYQLEALKSAKSFGARHTRPPGIFFGFEMGVLR